MRVRGEYRREREGLASAQDDRAQKREARTRESGYEGREAIVLRARDASAGDEQKHDRVLQVRA